MREHQIIFVEDCARILIDSKLFGSNQTVIRWHQELLFPLAFGKEIIKTLLPDYRISVSNSTLNITKEKIIATVPDKNETAPVNKNNSPQKYQPTTAEKISFIIIDPGHGGKDPGAVGKSAKKLYEKNITLSVAKKVGELIKKKNPSLKIYYTRTTDTFVELGGRTEFANRKLTSVNGGLFISIHVNASISPNKRGIETYYLSQNPSNDEARSTAALENNVVVLENPGRRKNYDDVEYIEALMLTTQIQKESRSLADKIQKSLTKDIKESPSRGVKTADFFVLRGALMPASLVEIGYITNKTEATRLTDKAYQDRISNSIASGIITFLSSYGK